jgi:uncharacterized damage-inducible protein DinB
MEAVVAPLAGVLELNTDLLLATPGAHRFPVPDASRLGLIAFLTRHDSYHIGQLAFRRRQLGQSPMAYTRGTLTASR